MILKYSFDGLRSGENVELIIKAHPIQIFWPITKAFVVVWVSILIYYYFSPISYLLYLDILLLLFGLWWLIEAFFCLKGTVTLVTNQRLIMREQEGFFRQQVSEVELNKIQELSTVLKGLISHVFNNGKVLIKTAAGDKSLLEIKNVPDPYLVQQKISELLSSKITN